MYDEQFNDLSVVSSVLAYFDDVLALWRTQEMSVELPDLSSLHFKWLV